MDFVKSFTGGSKEGQRAAGTTAPVEQKQGGGGFLGGLGDKFNSAAGGGRESEKNEDFLDKGKPLLPTPCCLCRFYLQLAFASALRRTPKPQCKILC